MTFELVMDLNALPFRQDTPSFEVAKILRRIADEIDGADVNDGDTDQRKDDAGNVIVRWVVMP